VKNLTSLTKGILIVLLLGVVGFALHFGGVFDEVRPMRIGVVTWGGNLGGQWYNAGFLANEESRFLKEYGLSVEFVLNDDPEMSLKAWEAGEIDVHWWTVDVFNTVAAELGSYSPKCFMQTDWSRGGDAVVVVRGIKSINDLRGRTIAVAYKTPSHSFLFWLLESGGMTPDDVKIIQVASAIDAAAAFKAGQVDAAVVWSPDDQGCIDSVKGSRILTNTKEAKFIIADILFAKEEYIEAHRDELVNLVEGWLLGAATVNSSPAAKKEGVRILADGLNSPEDYCLGAIDNVRLTTLGDNSNFFNLKGNYTGVDGEDVYTKTGRLYQRYGIISDFPDWRTVIDPSILRDVISRGKLTGTMHAAEAITSFALPTAQQASAPALATKRVTINFASGSWTLDENAMHILDLEVADALRFMEGNRVRVVGNTDNLGDYQMNMTLSQKRAEAVVDYLVSEYNFDRNRFSPIGKGPDNPVAGNETSDGRAKNRRTDIELL